MVVCLSYCGIVILTEASETCGFVVTFWTSLKSAVGRIFGGWSLLRGFYCSKLSPFVDKGSFCGLLEYLSLSRFIDTNDFIFIYFRISLAPCATFLDLYKYKGGGRGLSDH